MVAYNPADPFNWLGIKAEQDAAAAGLNADGSTRYTLPGGMGADPEYIAYLTQYDNAVAAANADSDLRRKRASDDYMEALRQLEQQGTVGARDVDNSLLSRGMFNSGERTVRQGELGQQIAQGRDRADVTLANTRGGIDADLQKALTELTAERERQIVASKARIAQTQRDGAAAAGFLTPAAAAVGSSAAPRPAATAPATSTPAPSSIPGTPGYVHDSIRPPTSTAASSAPRPTTTTSRPTTTATTPRRLPTVTRY